MTACASQPQQYTDNEPGFGSKFFKVIIAGMGGMGRAGSQVQYQDTNVNRTVNCSSSGTPGGPVWTNCN